MVKNELIETGKIINTHGIHGEIKLQPWADTPDFLTGFEYYYIDGMPVRVLSAKVHKGHIIATLEGIDDIDSAIGMKNKVVSVRKDDILLEEGMYFIKDLIGLTAIDDRSGESIGVIPEVLTFPANNVYVIKGDREILVPAVSEFIVETSIEQKYVKLRLIEGM